MVVGGATGGGFEQRLVEAGVGIMGLGGVPVGAAFAEDVPAAKDGAGRGAVADGLDASVLGLVGMVGDVGRQVVGVEPRGLPPDVHSTIWPLADSRRMGKPCSS